LLPAPPPAADVAEPEPFKGAQCRWIGAQPVQKLQILFPERPERGVAVHPQIVLHNATLSAAVDDYHCGWRSALKQMTAQASIANA
jgi:hypothetical protein